MTRDAFENAIVVASAIAGSTNCPGVQVWAHDPYVHADRMRADHVRPVDLDELIRESDYLCIQAPLTPDTRHLFNDSTLARMKPTAILINTARGPIVEDTALDRALRAATIAAAALDDLEEEPAKRASWAPTNSLLHHPNGSVHGELPAGVQPHRRDLQRGEPLPHAGQSRLTRAYCVPNRV
jgi:D-3-phosphoglycerate dehydrogenase